MAVRKEIAICKIVFQVFAFIIFIFNVKCYCSLSSNDSAKIRQFPDTAKFQRVIRRDFQHAFNPKPVKQSNSPFCAPQLILFQKRKHRVEHLNTLSTTNNKIQKAIRNLPQFLSSSVPQFFSDPSLLS